VTKPEATYLVWLDFSKLGLSGESLREFFEKRAHVIVTYGESLGTGGEGHIRFNIGAPRALIERGLQRIAEAYRAS